MLELACVYLWLIHCDLMSPCCVAHPLPSIGDPGVNEVGRPLLWLWPPAGCPVGETNMTGITKK